MKRSDKPDPVAVWRRGLDPSLILAYPLVRPVTTLQAVEDRLVAVGNWLGTLHDDRPDEREQGLAVGNLAVDFAFRLLDHLGLEVNDGPAPPITNLEMADLPLETCWPLFVLILLRFATSPPFKTTIRILKSWSNRLRNRAAWKPQMRLRSRANRRPQRIGRFGNHSSASRSGKFDNQPNTFTVSYKGKSCFLGNKTMFHLLVRLNQSPSTPVSYHTLAQDVWGDDLTTDWTIQKQANLLKKKLRAEGLQGVEINGSVKGHYSLILR